MVRTEQEMGRVMGTRKKGGRGGGGRNKTREKQAGESTGEIECVYTAANILEGRNSFLVNNTINKFTVGLFLNRKFHCLFPLLPVLWCWSWIFYNALYAPAT